MNRALLLISHFLIFSSFSLNTNAQKLSSSLSSKEDTLKLLGSKIVNAEFAEQRFRADSHFTRVLVRALQLPYSFNYAFDSLGMISRLYSPDSSFRIFTWQVSKDENVYRRHGAIQMNTNDGSLKLFPLIDRSNLIVNQKDTVSNNEWWIGSIYYKILKNQYNNQCYYTLLGYDEYSRNSTRKRIEILYFNDQQKPVFGAPLFVFNQDSKNSTVQSRFWLEYKKNVAVSIKYDDDLKMIVYDHLISETNEKERPETYIPDGDYEGFKWLNGKWVHMEKPFNFTLEDGQAPIEKPVLESKFPVRKTNKKGN
ncbi:MAG: hypothetical protein RLY11_172 [Bacteroidota bacterium]